MIFDTYGTLLTPDGHLKFNNDPFNGFDSFCFTATILVKKGTHEHLLLGLGGGSPTLMSMTSRSSAVSSSSFAIATYTHAPC